MRVPRLRFDGTVPEPSPYTDLDRPPLQEARLRRSLGHLGAPWRDVTVVDQTGSTNTDLAAAAKAGEPAGAVLLAERQTAGRGRLDRRWEAPARASIHLSVLLRPALPAARLGWLPLLTGLAVVQALHAVAGVDARLKWPNDVLCEEYKLAGILAERAGGAVVVGVGLNVTQRQAELPVPTATSLALCGAVNTDRAVLVLAVLRELAARYMRWQDAAGDAAACGLATEYTERCATLGRQVRVSLPTGAEPAELTGTATGVDADGALLVGGRVVNAGDVVHLRPADG